MTTYGESVTLAARLVGDDEGALAECQAEFGSALRRYLRRLVPADLVDDVVQAVLVEVWRCRHRLDPEAPLRGWIFTIARRRAVDQLRARPPASLPLSQALARPAEPGQPGQDPAERVARAQDVRRALAALPHVQREALVLAYFEDLTQTEIAARTGAPLGTVKARTARGLRSMGALLEA